jgi:hypothetical protein
VERKPEHWKAVIQNEQWAYAGFYVMKAAAARLEVTVFIVVHHQFRSVDNAISLSDVLRTRLERNRWRLESPPLARPCTYVQIALRIVTLTTP